MQGLGLSVAAFLATRPNSLRETRMAVSAELPGTVYWKKFGPKAELRAQSVGRSSADCDSG